MASWRDDLELATARLAALEAAEEKALTGGRVRQVSYDGGGVTYHAEASSLADLQRAIRECTMVIANLNGGARRGGAIIPVFR